MSEGKKVGDISRALTERANRWLSDLGGNTGGAEMEWDMEESTYPQQVESTQLTLSALSFPAEPPENEAWCKLARCTRLEGVYRWTH